MGETVPTICRLCIAHCGVLATVEDDAGLRQEQERCAEDAARAVQRHYEAVRDPVIMGLSLLTYAVNVFLFATGRLALNAPAVLNKYEEVPYTDPLPQALVLTAIVISFGMTAVIVMIALSAYLSSKDDHIDMTADDCVDDAGEDA